LNRDDAVVFLKMIKMKKEENMGLKGEVVVPVKAERESVVAVDD
jgi:hypothetical protein